jgi:hypothetical protein
MEGN